MVKRIRAAPEKGSRYFSRGAGTLQAAVAAASGPGTLGGPVQALVCGRFTLTTPPAALARHFGLCEAPSLAPRYNIAPTQPVAVVRRLPERGSRTLEMRRWGLVPAWAKDPRLGNRLINARAETATVRPAFRAAFARRRCLVPADGFYEWKRLGARKRPFLIRVQGGEPFAIAGLWEHWEGNAGQKLDSCTLLTTEANARVRPVHDRMPVILARESWDLWLDPEVQEAPRLEPLLRPCPPEWLDLHAVGLRVNDPRHDDPNLVEVLPASSDLSDGEGP